MPGACAGRYEGTLESGVVYQLLTDAGRFAARFAHDGIVADVNGELIRGDAPSFTYSEAGDFRLILTRPGRAIETLIAACCLGHFWATRHARCQGQIVELLGKVISDESSYTRRNVGDFRPDRTPVG